MPEIQITEGPKEPCDYPAPEPGSTSASHTHTDGRVCAWNAEEDTWWTVAATPKSEFTVATQVMPGEPEVPQKERGAYPKFLVGRADGRDQPGGDRHDALLAYCVLDPIFDPAARPAVALYAKIVRRMGYEKFADDLDHNLALLNQMASEALEVVHVDSETRPLRVIATWTFDSSVEAYSGSMEDSGQEGLAGAQQMALFEMAALENNQLGVEDMLSWGEPDSLDVIVMPNG